MYRWMWGAALAAVVACTAGCGTDDPVRGLPAPGPLLKTTAPLAPHQEKAAEQGALAEGVRMAEVTLHPRLVDDALVAPGSSGALTRAMLLVTVGHNGAITDAADDLGMLSGYLTSHSTHAAGRITLTHGVIRFPDQATAIRAADAMAQAAVTTPGMLETAPRIAIPLAAVPEARFTRYPGATFHDSMAFTPHREYVILTRVSAPDTATTEDYTVRAVGLQRPLLDSFTATDPSDYPDLSRDPSGLLALTVGSGGAATGAYGPTGAALLAYGGPDLTTLFTETGMDAMAVGRANVYRTRDAETAHRLTTGLTGSTLAGYRLRESALAPAYDSPTEDSACWSVTTDTTATWFCLLTTGRYVAEVWERERDAAHTALRDQRQVLATAP